MVLPFICVGAWLCGATWMTAGAVSQHQEEKRRAEACETERRAEEERKRVERAKQLARELVERQRQEALNQMRIKQNVVLCKSVDAQRDKEYQRFCTLTQEIVADRDLRIAEIEKAHDAFVCQQQAMLAKTQSDLGLGLMNKLEGYHREEDAMDRCLAGKRAQLEKKRKEIEKLRKEEEMKAQLWSAICKMLADANREGGADNLLTYLPSELLDMLEPEQLEMLSRLYGGNGGTAAATTTSDEEMKEEIRAILVQSALILRQILDKFELKPSSNASAISGKNVLQIDGQKVAALGPNDLFFVLCNGGEMFAKVIVEADALNTEEFVPALCNYASMTELPQLIVPNIVLRFSESLGKSPPNMAAHCKIFRPEKQYESNKQRYMAINRTTMAQLKFVVEITSTLDYCPKITNFQLIKK